MPELRGARTYKRGYGTSNGALELGEKIMQLMIRIPEQIVKRIDAKKDGVHLRSRSQIIAIAVFEWLKTKKKAKDRTETLFWTKERIKRLSKNNKEG